MISATSPDMASPVGPTIVAIDPGVSGGVALYSAEAPASVAVSDMPTVDGEVDPAALARLIREARPAFAVVERVGPMPRDGVRQNLSSGAHCRAAL